MARYLGPKCKLSRREGTDLFLKSRARPLESKCQIDKIPGLQGTRPGRLSDYALQLREKQKLRRIYCVLEKQFRKYYQEAARRKGATGENLLQILECRLDNIVYRMGFSSSRKQARQLVRQNHFTVNGKKVNIPSFQVSTGDVIEVKEKSKKLKVVLDSLETVVRRGIPAWVDLDKDKLCGTLTAIPNREDLTMPMQEQLIVELYSK